MVERDYGSGSGKNAFICCQVVGADGWVTGVDRNASMLALSREAAPSDASVDVVLSKCVLNLVNPSARDRLLGNIQRVLASGGLVAISDIVCDRPVPRPLQEDPALWSGCISGAWQEEAFWEAFRQRGFQDVHDADRSLDPWRELERIAFRAVTLVATHPSVGRACR